MSASFSGVRCLSDSIVVGLSRRVFSWARAAQRCEQALAVGLAVQSLVTIIMVMSETLPLANVKSKFSEMVDRVEHTHDRIIVTRNGRPAAVLISPEELESLEDTLDLLSDPEAMREIAESKTANESGDYIEGDELRRRYPAK